MNTFKTIMILLVEDDQADQKLVKISLTSQRIINELHVANSGEEALEYLQSAKDGNNQASIPDLILLDLNMPGMGGKEFLRKVKSDNELCTIPVVILTTSDIDRDILESYKLQAAGYIKKPVSLEQFQVVMNDLTDYWFVICKRVAKSHECEHKDNKCFVG